MQTPFISGYSSQTLDDTDTEYNSCWGAGYIWESNHLWRSQLIPASGVIKLLRVELTASPNGATKSYTFTLMLNGNPTALTCAITNAETSNEDIVNEVVVSAGDYISLRCAPANTPDVVSAQWTMMFEGDTSSESIVIGGDNGALNITSTQYNCLACGYNNWVSDETAIQQIIPTNGTIKNLYVRLSEAPANGGKYTFTLFVAGAPTTLTCGVTDPATTASDLVNTVAVAAGQSVSIRVSPSDSPTATPYAYWGVVFVPATRGYSMQLGSETAGPDDTDESFIQITPNPTANSWNGGLINVQQLTQACTLSNFFMAVDTAPGAGKSILFEISVNGIDSGVSVLLEDSDTTGNSGAASAAVNAGDNIAIHATPTGTPTTDYCHWGLQSYIAYDSPVIIGSSISSLISAGII